MAKRSEFVEHLVEMLGPLGDVSARRMFGGWGIFLEGKMFALVIHETLFIKADDANRADFESRGLEAFRYEARGKWNSISYYQPPTDALEDPALLCHWARHGVEAAARALERGQDRKPSPKATRRRRSA